LRRPRRSDHTPENTFTASAVASAAPSINPTVSALAASAVVRNTGNSAWIISDEMSISRLTKPSVQIAGGRR